MIAPIRLQQLDASQADGRHPELAALLALSQAGLPVASLVVVPSAAETRFYELNNLPARLRALFAGVDPYDPDEDDLEALAPEAKAMIQTHFLLDEFIDQFYAALAPLSPRLRLRRAGDHPGLEAAKGRPALLALKALWAAEWSQAAIAARLRQAGTLAPSPTAVIVHEADMQPAPEPLLAQVKRTVPGLRHAWVNPAHQILGVS